MSPALGFEVSDEETGKWRLKEFLKSPSPNQEETTSIPGPKVAVLMPHQPPRRKILREDILNELLQVHPTPAASAMPPKLDPKAIKVAFLRCTCGEVGALSALAPKVGPLDLSLKMVGGAIAKATDTGLDVGGRANGNGRPNRICCALWNEVLVSPVTGVDTGLLEATDLSTSISCTLSLGIYTSLNSITLVSSLQVRSLLGGWRIGGGQVKSAWRCSHRLPIQDIASPVALDLIISVIVIGPDGFHQLCQSSFVFQVDLCEGDSGAGLPVDQTPRPGLPLENAVGNPHLTTQGRQENHQLNGIHIMCNHYQLSLLVFHQGYYECYMEVGSEYTRKGDGGAPTLAQSSSTDPKAATVLTPRGTSEDQVEMGTYDHAGKWKKETETLHGVVHKQPRLYDYDQHPPNRFPFPPLQMSQSASQMCESWGDMEKKLRDILTNSAVAKTTKEACAWKTLALAVGLAERQKQQDTEKVKKLQDQLDEQKLFTNVLVGTVNRLRNAQKREKEKAQFQFQQSLRALRGVEEERNLLRNELLRVLSAQAQKREGAAENKKAQEAWISGMFAFAQGCST
ncbi:hypothetical protein GH733_019378 [Mirounga leonina]|nr:hypothetical protein GH733_019378 [Mirounga leonina]